MTGAAPRRETALRRVVRNFLTLLGGRALAGLLALAATLLSARALGPSGFGLVAVIHAYTQTVRGLVNLKSFEAIVRFGTPLLESGDTAALGALLRTCLLVDLACAVLGTLIALAFIPLAGRVGLWPDELASTAAICVLVLLFSGYATASGVLRLFDRFRAISAALVLSNAARLLGVVIVISLFDGGVQGIAYVWALSQAVQYLGILFFGWREARGRVKPAHLYGRFDVRGAGKTHPGIWHFMHVVYWQSSLDLIPKSGATLLAGSLLGAESAGLYRIAREFANFVSKPALLARQAIYPDLARLRHRKDEDFSRVIRAIVVMLGIPALMLTALSWFHGAAGLSVTVGESYAPASVLMTWLVAAATLELAGSPLRPAAYTLGRAGEQLRVQIIACVIFVSVFAVATERLGLSGPGIAALAFYAVVLAGNGLIVERALRRAVH